MAQIRIDLNSSANNYANKQYGERIINFSDPVSGRGGLISIRRGGIGDDGEYAVIVDVYNTDKGVEVLGKSRRTSKRCTC